MTTLVCPKCLGRMRTVERHHVIFEPCEECGGIFLDRGELEQLIRAEGAYYRRPPDWDDESEPSYPRKRPKKKKLRHFLEELLDFD
ncbi:MAG: zf-TFIIB domain-containing protein [Thermomicrobium sp.]|nr:zf-TFIIB domain-containing protein [Thermomicrobium sp.]MDW8005605.1 zf-TFIIB domain-containing protein [Thermomicrobium sp.]